MRQCLRTFVAVLVSMAVCLAAGGSTAIATEVLRLEESNWNDTVPRGKEVDAIYGDWVLRNQRVIAVIGAAVPGRNANMTVRNTGGSVIDLTRR